MHLHGAVPWVPKAFLARFPVAAYETRLGLRPISPDTSEKKKPLASGTQGNGAGVGLAMLCIFPFPGEGGERGVVAGCSWVLIYAD